MKLSIRIFPLAFDSLGVRSESTLVDADGTWVLIDPGVSLAPKRYGLPPSEPELRALELSRQLIMDAARKAEYIIVTHYHYDHHPHPNDDEFYNAVFPGKRVFAKQFRSEVTNSARVRGKKFFDKTSGLADSVELCDDKSFEINGVKLVFSPPVWHGAVGSRVGRVVMVSIEVGEKSFLHGSDAQNLADPQALAWVLNRNPDFMIIDGYPTILVGWKVSKKSLEASIDNVKKAVTGVKADKIIIDHHIVRDIRFKEKMKGVYDVALKKNKTILTAAEYYGLNNFLLEAWRKEFHKGTRSVDVEEYYGELRKRIKVL